MCVGERKLLGQGFRTLPVGFSQEPLLAGSCTPIQPQHSLPLFLLFLLFSFCLRWSKMGKFHIKGKRATKQLFLEVLLPCRLNSWLAF